MTAITVGVIAGLFTAFIVGIDSALGGKNTKEIAFDMATGFLTGFTMSALLVLIGPVIFAKIAAYLTVLGLVLGGIAAVQSFRRGYVGQGIFRVITTILTAGFASAAVRQKATQFAGYLWGRMFPRSPTTPALGRIGSSAPNPNGRVRAVYNTRTREVKYKDSGSMHPEIVEEAGWGLEDRSNLIGGNVALDNGQVIGSNWRNASGLLGGDGRLAFEAEAATAIIQTVQNGGQIALGILGGATTTMNASSLSAEDIE